MPWYKLRIGTFIALAVSHGLLASACSVDQATPQTSYQPCAPAGTSCLVQTPDANFVFDLPDKWNGRLLLWAHTGDEVAAGDNSLPVDDNIRAEVKSELLAAGYAMAAGKRDGMQWDAQLSQDLAQDTYAAFTSQVGQPNQVFLWGQGTSALMTTLSKHEWISGKAPLCGNLGGINPNFDIALDATFALKALLVGDLQLANYQSAQEAQANFDKAMAAVQAAVQDPRGDGPQRLEFIMAVAKVPTKTATSSGLGPENFAAAAVSNLRDVMLRSTVERYEIEQFLGGNPSANTGVDYAVRIDERQRERINRGENERVDAYLAELDAQQRVAADETARTVAATATPLTGEITNPTVVLHTEYDAQAIVENVSLYQSAAVARGRERQRLLNVNITKPPVFYPDSGGVGFGAGHCNFTADSVVGIVQVLSDWVVDGQFPSQAGNVETLGSASGYDPLFVLPPWPAGPTQK